MTTDSSSSRAPAPPTSVSLSPLTPFKPDLYERAWSSTPHPTLPLLATAHGKAVTVFSLSTLSKHSALSGGHTRSVRCATWKPGLPSHKLCLVTGSFDATAGLWRYDGDNPDRLELDVASAPRPRRGQGDDEDDDDGDTRGGDGEDDWEFTLVLEGHENEIKSVAFSPSGQHLATCSRDKSVWIWEDVGATEADDEWETVAVLNEHDADVKAVAWAPDAPGTARRGGDVLASASYDDTVRIWREDPSDGEWVCVAVLEGHKGTVWGIQWEPRPAGTKFPRLLTFSADMTARIWQLKEDEQEEEGGPGGAVGARSGFGGIPNTMRRSLREEWICTTILPKAHTRDIYSASWSPESGMVATTGSDGIIAVYAEGGAEEEDARMTSPAAQENGEAGKADENGVATANGSTPGPGKWRLLTTVSKGHGPYEINHVTWCKRFDPGTERRGIEEMLVTTGDDGIVRPWQVTLDP